MNCLSPFKAFMPLIVAALASLSFIELSAENNPRIVAHRGFWQTTGSAQNSIKAMALADSIGAYATEFDVNMTADSALVVNHDYIFKGVDISKTPKQEVINIRLDNGELLPTLHEFLSAAQRHPRLRLILELKEIQNRDLERYAVGRVAEYIDFYDLADRIDFISFSQDACDEMHRLRPSASIFYLGGDLTPEEVARRGYAGISYYHERLAENPDWIERAHRLGLLVNVWTVKDPAMAAEFAARGVDLITTDVPDQLISGE